jgi:hypothetical protein
MMSVLKPLTKFDILLNIKSAFTRSFFMRMYWKLGLALMHTPDD